MRQSIPTHLYKYKSFSVDCLDLLVSDALYFADPTTFNDPLDCNPSILNNIEDIDKIRESVIENAISTKQTQR
ncbi:TPA: hypothetical protein ACKRTJ_002778 [Proteus mirabilis]|uniref:hypothetical protein n=1 Tax=Proteus TaxID=583 RepID=UPI000537D91C|nr:MULTISPECIES: hypothetical protein [Proteus]AUU39286.1 hypothetical protein MC73_009965 [Proteus mirabilis]EJD6086129.1 hypothetical protein [Proteus mirabilis]EKV7293397.1 hypothetical protein [Proteus mirabilis]EKX9515229.1 hypothetical protein [Proteus mirabilis]ELA6787837.1 hypothetical protein [Proteus mirabilis]